MKHINDQCKTKKRLMNELSDLRLKVLELMDEIQGHNDIRVSFLNNSIAGCCCIKKGVIMWANDKLSEMSNIPLNQLQGSRIDILAPLDEILKNKYQETEEALCRSEWFEYESDRLWGNENIKNVRILLKAINLTEPREGLLCLFEDITEQKQKEQTIKEETELLAGIVEYLPDATVVVDSESRVIAWNQAMETLTGVRKEEMIGKGDFEYALPIYGYRRPILVDLVRNPEAIKECNYSVIKKDRDYLYAEKTAKAKTPDPQFFSATASLLRNKQGEIIAAIECIRNTTEYHKAEERSKHAEKIEVLGTIAGGVAHDLNNIMGVMIGYSELLINNIRIDGSARHFAESIFQSSLRCSAIIQDLLTLTRRGVTTSEVINLNYIVTDFLNAPEFDKMQNYHPGVSVLHQLDESLLNMMGSTIHISKTVMNLVSNAVEAIEGEGEVKIITENCYLDQPISGYEEIQEGEYVLLSISDTGEGIAEADRLKIFEPFYTKKVMGRSGTGLGLAVVWGTVKDHNGYVSVQNNERKGTIFKLYFPSTREKKKVMPEPILLDMYRGRGEKILVVDDIKEQREMAVDMLGALGYRVNAVGGGEEAVEYIKGNKVDLMILDMIMTPGIDGMETYRQIMEINPNQKAIIVSGFSETEKVKNTLEMGAAAFVRKPYTITTMGMEIRKALNYNTTHGCHSIIKS